MDRLGNPPQWTAPLSTAVPGPSNNQLAPQQYESQTQLQAQVSAARKQDDGRMFKARDWEDHREEITALYENNTLENVMKSIQARYGLVAT